MKSYTYIVILLLLSFGKSHAADYLLSPQVHRLISDTTLLMKESSYEKAELKIKHSVDWQSLRIIEQAVLAHQLGVIYVALKDYLQAQTQFERALRVDALPPVMQLQLRYNLAQVYLTQDKPQVALEILQPVVKREEIKPEFSFLIAACYAKLGHLSEGWLWVTRGLQNQTQLVEQHYALAVQLSIALGYYSDAHGLLEKLVQSYPKKLIYNRQLMFVLIALDKQSQALATGELAYQRGLYTSEADILQLVHLYLHQNVPYQAAQLLNREIALDHIQATPSNLRLLASAWLRAREYQLAVVALEQITKSSKSGELFLYLAHIFAEQGNWIKTQQLLRHALSDAGLGNQASAHLLQGITLLKVGNDEQAWYALNKASEFDSTRASALAWMDYLKLK